MTTIILVFIGVLLAAASALMTVYYGGSSMSSGQVKARAATLENAAQNIQAAMTGRRFRGVQGVPDTLDQLVSVSPGGGWLGSLPNVEEASAGSAELMDDGGDRLYAVPGVSEAVCMQVNRDYNRTGAVPEERGDESRGCFRHATRGIVFFTVLGRSA